MTALIHSADLDRPEMVCIGLGLVGLGLWVHYMLAVWRESLRSRKEISRYAMFEARDRLVRLVVDGEIAENDPAWRATYASVTELLKMHQRVDLFAVLRNFAHYLLQVLTNPTVRSRAERLDHHLKKAKKASPAFAEVSNLIEAAFRRMVGMRTTAFHRLRLRAFMLWLRIKLAVRPPKVVFVSVAERPREQRRRIRRTYAGGVSRTLRPSSLDIAGFSSTCAA